MLSPNSQTMHISAVATSAIGFGTARDKRNLVAGSILQQIKEFFICSNMRDELSFMYDKFMEETSSTLYHYSQSLSDKDRRLVIPDRLVISPTGGIVTITLPDDPTAPAIIEIDNGSKNDLSIEINAHIYRSVCTSLLIRRWYGLPFTTTPLTDDKRIDLRESNLQNARLCYAYLPGANLEKTHLSSANLREAKLQETNLRWANLQDASLLSADLEGADLKETNLQGANLWKANMTLVNLKKTNLQGANLQEANLEGANLQDTTFIRADLTDACLAGSRLENIDLLGACLSGAVLSPVLISTQLLHLPKEWNEDKLNEYLDLTSHAGRGNLLTMMASIDEEYPRIKLRMAHELKESLRNVNLNKFAPSLLEVLSRSPWNTDPGINDWLDKLCLNYLAPCNKSVLVMPQHSAGIYRQAASLFSRRTELMYTYNNAFIQLVIQGTENVEHRDDIIRLYNTYLTGKKIKPYTTFSVFAGGYGIDNIDWENRHAVNIILTSPRSGGPVMLLSQNTLQKMLKSAPLNAGWDQFYLYKNREILSPDEKSLPRLLSLHFPLLHMPQQSGQQ